MTAERQPLSKLFRFAISLLIIGHLLAVFLPPLSFQTRGPLGQSPSVGTLLRPVEAYGQFLYIDRGYAFFAPDPGPSHLVQAAITGGDGQMTERMFPDREDQWPRLLYHRHFMLTEFLEELYRPPGPPAELVELDRDEADLWVRTRARYEHVRQSVVEHLKHENPGSEVAIRRIEHLVPEIIAYQQDPIELTDPRLYRVLLDQPIDLEQEGDLAAPIGPPETIPPPTGAAQQREAMIAAEGDDAASIEDNAVQENSDDPADIGEEKADEVKDPSSDDDAESTSHDEESTTAEEENSEQEPDQEQESDQEPVETREGEGGDSDRVEEPTTAADSSEATEPVDQQDDPS